MTEIRWHGRGGQGAFTAAKLLGNAALRDGSYALSFPSFGPERRGAPIQAYTKISDKKITDRSALRRADYLIYLDETLFSQECLSDLKPQGLVFLNTKTPQHYAAQPQIVAYDADKISGEVLGRAIANTAMLTLAAKHTGLVKKESLLDAFADYLSANAADKNRQLAERIFSDDQTNVERI